MTNASAGGGGKLPPADLDPGSGAVVLPFPKSAIHHIPPTPTLPASPTRDSLRDCTDAAFALTRAASDLASSFEALHDAAQTLHQSCRTLDVEARAVRYHANQMFSRTADVTSAAARIRARLLAVP